MRHQDEPRRPQRRRLPDRGERREPPAYTRYDERDDNEAFEEEAPRRGGREVREAEPTQRTEPIEFEEVMELLRSIDRHRSALAADAATLRYWLWLCPDLDVAWRKFCAQGGITAEDFDRSIMGRLRRRPLHGRDGPAARVKRHLRLVASNPKPARRQVRPHDGHDAA